MSLVVGDCRVTLARWAAEGVRMQCVVTSPPYWGLRDYGTAPLVWGGDAACSHEWALEGRVMTGGGYHSNSTLAGFTNPNTKGRQMVGDGISVDVSTCLRCSAWRGSLGLEPTPELYVSHLVDVFRLVRDVLAEDGTCWINLGDSYATGAGKVGDRPGGGAQGDAWAGYRGTRDGSPKHTAGALGPMTQPNRMPIPGLKPKDLCGIPWMVAKALQAPYYTGRIPSEVERAWLAAAIDGEGCIYVQRRPAGTATGRVKADGSRSGYTADQFQPGIRITNTNEAFVRRAAAIARVGTVRVIDKGHRTVFEWSCYTQEARSLLAEVYPHLVAKQHEARLGIGCKPTGGEAAWQGLKLLHHGRPTSVDFPAPPSCYEPGWWLRSDIIWAKPNPMPESVTDRPTKAHEYLFLLTKRERYYYDSEAIKEPVQASSLARIAQNDGHPKWNGARERGYPGPPQTLDISQLVDPSGRNRRSVWTIATRPYPDAHFATFPEDLVKPCILAGSRPGDTVLDPFMGSGTVAKVAQDLGRQWLGCELNPAYAPMCERRTPQGGLAL